MKYMFIVALLIAVAFSFTVGQEAKAPTHDPPLVANAVTLEGPGGTIWVADLRIDNSYKLRLFEFVRVDQIAPRNFEIPSTEVNQAFKIESSACNSTCVEPIVSHRSPVLFCPGSPLGPRVVAQLGNSYTVWQPTESIYPLKFVLPAIGTSSEVIVR